MAGPGDTTYYASVDFWAGNFAPVNWAFCRGQLLPIEDNQALFSLLGITFGGDGRNNFGLPDMQGRVPVGAGQGPGLSPRVLGQMEGTEDLTLTIQQMPEHTHGADFRPSDLSISVLIPVQDDNMASGGTDPVNKYLGPTSSEAIYYDQPADNANLGSPEVAVNMEGTITVDATGGSDPCLLMQPFTVLNCIICIEGLYPPRQ